MSQPLPDSLQDLSRSHGTSLEEACSRFVQFTPDSNSYRRPHVRELPEEERKNTCTKVDRADSEIEMSGNADRLCDWKSVYELRNRSIFTLHFPILERLRIASCPPIKGAKLIVS